MIWVDICFAESAHCVIAATGERFEMAACGHRILLCSFQVSLWKFRVTSKVVSFSFCKWWVDATFVAVEKLTRTEINGSAYIKELNSEARITKYLGPSFHTNHLSLKLLNVNSDIFALKLALILLIVFLIFIPLVTAHF